MATFCACTASLSPRRSREAPRPILPIFVLHASGKVYGLVSYGGGGDCATSSTSYSYLACFSELDPRMYATRPYHRVISFCFMSVRRKRTHAYTMSTGAASFTRVSCGCCVGHCTYIKTRRMTWALSMLSPNPRFSLPSFSSSRYVLRDACVCSWGLDVRQDAMCVLRSSVIDSSTLSLSCFKGAAARRHRWIAVVVSSFSCWR